MAEPNQALTESKQGYVYGDVAIAPGVAMATGVLLGAEPGCRLVISAGVCLGSDVVIRVSQGQLVIEPGANLGSGVLVVGSGHIGHHACIGANSTLINPAVKAHQVVPPKSLWGDPTAPQGPAPGTESPPPPEPPPSPGPATPSGERVPVAAAELGNEEPAAIAVDSPAADATNGAVPPGSSPPLANAVAPTNGAHVYGKQQVSQLLDTLFPHRRPLNGTAPEDRA